MKNKIIKSLEGFVSSYVMRIEESQLRFQTVASLNEFNKHSEESLVDENHNIVVSLTTFGRRIHEVYLTIESLGQQTLKPKRILLWLAEDEFSNKTLPISLQNLVKRGLEIKFCADIRSYKKLVPTLKMLPNETIITVDDDILYGRHLLEILWTEHQTTPDQIICGSAKEMTFTNKSVSPYGNWLVNSENCKRASFNNIAIGFGAVLYFPGCFSEEVINENLFLKYSPTADDLWFKAMSKLKGVKVRSVSHLLGTANQSIAIESAQEDSLSIINVINGRNDEQFQAILKAYPELNFND
jgi:hypothetical protein